jgi:hypothetical protein
MRNNFLLKKSGVVGIITFFICSSFVTSIGGYTEDTDQVDIDINDVFEFKEDVLVSCSTFGFPGEQSKEITISSNDAEFLYDKMQELQFEVAHDPVSDKIKQLQHEILTLAEKHDLLPVGLSVNSIKSRLTPTINTKHPKFKLTRSQNNTASEMFCNYVSTGTGSALPIIILPRLVPILLTPIPRLFVRWKTMEGMTSCGGLRSGTGFIAFGAQNGIALGFWGIGFSIFLPPVSAYGLFGYALYASVNAEHIEPWPPNWSPEITILSPPDGAKNVPVSTSELTFKIKDDNDDLMNYTVTTDPDIGSGSGSSILGGTYSVPISDLEGTEKYTWHVQVDDGVNFVEISSSFTTEPVAPVISDPKPEDGKRFVPIDLSMLSFHISDPQNDLMDYTVETKPDIGSGNGYGVGEGTYSIDVSGLENLEDYTWYVNVTDGTYWKHKVFGFQTEPIMVFDPYDEGWLYRKNITIDHTKVAGDLTNFPVLVSTVDFDLRDKAQEDGDDILFMDGDSVATRLYHEIEHFDDSSGELVAWLNLTDIASDQDTTFYMYYGNSGCTSQQFPDSVWDPNYCGVWHLDNFLDSTINDNDGANYGTDDITGKIGIAKDFVETNNDYISLGDMPEPADGSISTATFEIWINPEKDSWGRGNLISKLDTSYEPDRKSYKLKLLDTGQVQFSACSGTWYPENRIIRFTTDESFIINDTWQYIVVVVDLAINEGIIYCNGEVKDSGVTILGTPPSYFYNVNLDERLGIANPESSGPYYYDGSMDEVRISKICRSSSWIKTEFENQNDPLGFMSFGSEETGP